MFLRYFSSSLWEFCFQMYCKTMSYMEWMTVVWIIKYWPKISNITQRSTKGNFTQKIITWCYKMKKSYPLVVIAHKMYLPKRIQVDSSNSTSVICSLKCSCHYNQLQRMTLHGFLLCVLLHDFYSMCCLSLE